ncbi:MAG TPA: hypothetical protein VK509_07075, partial [Polyangiales bacterium]|nr:hypothetical protein [Polyangiales bacterium]
PLRAGSSLGYRGELLGTQQVDATVPDARCEDCSASYDIPLGYHGPRAALWLSWRLQSWLRAAARVAGELRARRSPAYLEVITPAGLSARAWQRRERDSRLNLGAGLTFELFDPLELDVDYDATIAGSNIDNSLGGEHTLDYANLEFVRHVLSLGVAAHF